MAPQQHLVAESFDSRFDLAHDSYNCITAADDGYIYYVLASADAIEGGRVYRFDTVAKTVQQLSELNTCCGERNAAAIAQGKSHDGFYRYKNAYWFSTHVGYYETIDGMERLPVHGVAGGAVYPGGHLLSIDRDTMAITDHLALPGEGIVTMTLDATKGIAYLLSWPTGLLYRYDIDSRQLKHIGKTAGNGEAGSPGKDYRVVCRSLLLVPGTGKLYGSSSEGFVFEYDPDANTFTWSSAALFRRDYFGQYRVADPGSMAWHWRKITWNPKDQCAYGVHGNSGYLFRFNPAKMEVELLHRITSLPSQRSGMFDLFSYGYLGFALDEEKQVIYYLCGGPLDAAAASVEQPVLARGGARGLENLHLVTYQLSSGTYHDHGPVFYGDGERPTYVNSIALGADGYVYALARIERKGRKITDLIRIPTPAMYKTEA